MHQASVTSGHSVRSLTYQPAGARITAPRRETMTPDRPERPSGFTRRVTARISFQLPSCQSRLIWRY